MAEELQLPDSGNKNEIYSSLLPQLAALIEYENDLIANLANLSAALHQAFGWWWVGFYWVKDNELVLGPFQGPIACTRIRRGKGVCGTVWQSAKSVLVPDVDAFPGHVACSGSSVSEIVVPIFDKNQQVVGVLDVDSERYDVLDETDVFYLEKLSELVSKTL